MDEELHLDVDTVSSNAISSSSLSDKSSASSRSLEHCCVVATPSRHRPQPGHEPEDKRGSMYAKVLKRLQVFRYPFLIFALDSLLLPPCVQTDHLV